MGIIYGGGAVGGHAADDSADASERDGGADETKTELTPTEINLIQAESKIHMPACYVASVMSDSL